jgi:ABC-type polysaccharide/polyol phosphate transport system ATPase subunit
MNPITVSHVSKQYQVGSQHHSLRDAIPALVKGWWGAAAPAGRQAGLFWALKDVSFEVCSGETLGIIGRNGAGKSTVLKLLSSITRPTSGSVRVRGKLAALIEVGAGFHPDLTGRENVFLNGTILGLKRRRIHALFDRIVEFAELESFIDTPVKRYSSGMYVRLGFAIAAHVDPEVLLIDEVLAVGDLAFQQKCLQRIQELKRAGTTMIFISHNLNAVQRICDRALFLARGEVAAEGEVATVIQAYREQVVTRERQRLASLRAKQQARQPDGGAGAVRIDAIELHDADGQPAESFATGDSLTIEVGYTCARRVERPRVTIGIDRLDGLVCHVVSAPNGQVAVPPMDGQGVLRLTYPALQLLPNTYRVSVEIGEEGSVAPLDSRQFGAFFTMTSDHHERGAVHLDHHWQWGHAG